MPGVGSQRPDAPATPFLSLVVPLTYAAPPAHVPSSPHIVGAQAPAG